MLRQVAADHSDYCMLLKDVYFIETGKEAIPIVMPTVILSTLMLLTIGAIFILIEFSAHNEQAAEYERTHHTWIVEGLLPGCAFVATIPMVVVLFLAAIGRLHRPFIHFGAVPGGGDRGRSNKHGGTSPFHIHLKKGGLNETVEDLVEWIRGAAIISRQVRRSPSTQSE